MKNWQYTCKTRNNNCGRLKKPLENFYTPSATHAAISNQMNENLNYLSRSDRTDGTRFQFLPHVVNHVPVVKALMSRRLIQNHCAAAISIRLGLLSSAQPATTHHTRTTSILKFSGIGSEKVVIATKVFNAFLERGESRQSGLHGARFLRSTRGRGISLHPSNSFLRDSISKVLWAVHWKARVARCPGCRL